VGPLDLVSTTGSDYPVSSPGSQLDGVARCSTVASASTGLVSRSRGSARTRQASLSRNRVHTAPLVGAPPSWRPTSVVASGIRSEADHQDRHPAPPPTCVVVAWRLSLPPLRTVPVPSDDRPDTRAARVTRPQCRPNTRATGCSAVSLESVYRIGPGAATPSARRVQLEHHRGTVKPERLASELARISTA
jgi:hypothetical protein